MFASDQGDLSSPLMGNGEVEQAPRLSSAATAVMINDINDQESDGVPRRPPITTSMWKNPAQLSAMISNFSTSYNVVNISLVLPILDTIYTVSEENDAACASSLLAGMVVGQLAGGALGDSFLGRLGALRVVMAFQIVASIGSSLLFGPRLLFWLAVWRFLLGIGAGGVYPLAAVLSAEQGDAHHALKIEDETPQERMEQLRRVVFTFSMQGVGFLAVPLLTVPLLYVTDNVNLVWRIILGFGSLPGLLMAVLQYKMYGTRDDIVPLNEPSDDMDTDVLRDNERASSETSQGHSTGLAVDEHKSNGEGFSLVTENEPNDISTPVAVEESPSSPPSGLWDSIKDEPHLTQKLLGTAGTWFLFDVLFYGNTLFQPIVMEAAFSGRGGDVLRKAASDSLILACIGLPGYILSAFVMGKRVCHVSQTPKFVQMQGFVAMALLYCTIGAYWPYLKRVPWLLVVLYGSTFFFANYGPNTTTFVFPSLVYSPECRSTLNGISAAAGKAGALVGATMFEPMSQELGDNGVMLICAGVSVLAFAMTRFFVQLPPVNSQLQL